MKKWTNWILGIIVFLLLFVAIPINYGSKNKKQLKMMFDNYIENFNKTYKNIPEEYELRFQHFTASVEEIDRLNAESRGPDEHKARYGLTKLSDMSKAEYTKVHLSDEQFKKPANSFGRSWHHRNHSRHSVHVHTASDVYVRRKRAALPMQVDWRAKGVIGPVRNQGLCGACWAFSTIGTIEAMAALKAGKLLPLSVQEAIDCAGLGNSGCNGGDICLLLDWLLLSKTTIVTEKQYPLSLMEGVCRLKTNVTGVQVKSFTCDDFVSDETKILEALATHGPVAVAVNALTWQNYLGGVIQYHCSGAAVDLNHAVQIVGYDLTAEVPYYIAKNSWGTEFGNGGYLNLAIGSNICGLANEVGTIDVV